MEIPATMLYTIMGSYALPAGLVKSMFPHPAMGMSHDLGQVVRDGTEVHLPYVTTDSRYNQRLVMVNRGKKAAKYMMSFDTPEAGGVTSQGGSDAMGMLAPMSTTVLHLTKDDVVDIMGGPPHRISGTLTIEALPKDISVATNQTNKETGGTDTVVLH